MALGAKSEVEVTVVLGRFVFVFFQSIWLCLVNFVTYFKNEPGDYLEPSWPPSSPRSCWSSFPTSPTSSSPSSSRPPWSSTSPSCWSSSQCSSLCLRDFPRPHTSRWLMCGWSLCFWFPFLRYRLCPILCICLCLFVFTNVSPPPGAASHNNRHDAPWIWSRSESPRHNSKG